MSVFLILLAAGDSKRLKSNTPKPYQIINNRSLLEHSLDAFGAIKEIKKTIIVYKNKHKKYIKKLILKNAIKIAGGKTRQESTFKALRFIKKMNCKKVLIHDVARPNTSKKLINEIINKLKNNHAVIPIVKTADATKRYEKNLVFKNIQRETLGFSQTPQGFTFSKIYKKHLENIDQTFDDDSALFTIYGEKVLAANGSKTNLKITNIEDLEIFKSLKKGKTYRGIGFDK